MCVEYFYPIIHIFIFVDLFSGKNIPPKKISKKRNDLDVKIVQIDSQERKILLTLQGLDEDDSLKKDFVTYLSQEKVKKESELEGKKQGSFGDLLKMSLNKSKDKSK